MSAQHRIATEERTIPATENCNYGVNPRFMLSMARIAIVKADQKLPELRRKGVMGYRAVADVVNVLAKMQLTNEQLLRLGQLSKPRSLMPQAMSDQTSSAPPAAMWSGRRTSRYLRWILWMRSASLIG